MRVVGLDMEGSNLIAAKGYDESNHDCRFGFGWLRRGSAEGVAQSFRCKMMWGTTGFLPEAKTRWGTASHRLVVVISSSPSSVTVKMVLRWSSGSRVPSYGGGVARGSFSGGRFSARRLEVAWRRWRFVKEVVALLGEASSEEAHIREDV
jgi:hypothetical protein